LGGGSPGGDAAISTSKQASDGRARRDPSIRCFNIRKKWVALRSPILRLLLDFSFILASFFVKAKEKPRKKTNSNEQFYFFYYFNLNQIY